MRAVFVVALLVAFATLAVSMRNVHSRAQDHYFAKGKSSSHTWELVDRAHPKQKISLVFAIKQNREAVHEILKAVSNPKSESYGQYLTLKELGHVLGTSASHAAVVNHLKSKNLKDITSTVNKEFVTVYLTAAEAEDLLATRFYEFQARKSNKRIHRTPEYSLPEELAEHVDFVGHTVAFPEMSPSALIHAKKSGKDQTVTPQVLFNYYNISNPVVQNTQATQSVYENLGQSYSPDDLAYFQRTYNLQDQPIAKLIGPNDASACAKDPNNCIEATLDIQYIMALAQNSPATFWSIADEDDPFTDWVVALSNDANAPLVHSISYGSIEPQGDKSSMQRFDDEVAKLGVRGITVVVASGDDGVANFIARGDSSKCGFNPSFPATSPHVTAVGASMGPEQGDDEQACLASSGGGITTGGGFSTVFSSPDYQLDAVQAYFKTGVKLPPSSQWNQKGRGYPDIATLGHNYNVYINKQDSLGSGTSASAPVFAAMLTLVNDMRMQNGKPALGFVNPALYQIASQVFRDMTQGENNCCADNQDGSPTCCKYGFYAASGWDPLTGLGGVDFPSMADALMAM